MFDFCNRKLKLRSQSRVQNLVPQNRAHLRKSRRRNRKKQRKRLFAFPTCHNATGLYLKIVFLWVILLRMFQEKSDSSSSSSTSEESSSESEAEEKQTPETKKVVTSSSESESSSDDEEEASEKKEAKQVCADVHVHEHDMHNNSSNERLGCGFAGK